MILCKICNKECKDARRLSAHIKYVHKVGSQQYYDTYLKIKDNICPICGNSTPFDNISKGYKECCSRKCVNNNPQRMEKINNTKKEKYGDDLSEIYKKQKDTVLGWSKKKKKEYSKNISAGIKNAIRNDKTIIERRLKTTKILHGDDFYSKHFKNVMKNKSKEDFTKSAEKRKNTCLKKYGVEHVMHVDEFVKKVQDITPEERSKWAKKAIETKINNGTILPFDSPLRNDKLTYKNKVHSLSHINAKKIFTTDELLNVGLCGKDKGLQLDHLLSIKDCYDNGVPEEIASHQVNLRLIPWQENRNKWHKSDITIDELYIKYKNFTIPKNW